MPVAPRASPIGANSLDQRRSAQAAVATAHAVVDLRSTTPPSRTVPFRAGQTANVYRNFGSIPLGARLGNASCNGSRTRSGGAPPRYGVDGAACSDAGHGHGES